MRSHNFCRSLPGYGNPVLPTGLLCDPEDTVQFLAQRRHIPADLVIGNLGVDLGRGDMFMFQHLLTVSRGTSCASVTVMAKVCRAMCIVGLNGNPACLAT